MKSKKKAPIEHEFESVALLLQGGGALGAYQAGVYEALYEGGVEPDWVAGISIGAVNAAIIAGNKPENRVRQLKDFWEGLTQHPGSFLDSLFENMVEKSGTTAHGLWNQAYANMYVLGGVPGFFKPHLMPPFFYPEGTLEATSFYETGAFKETLEKHIDFDLLNSGKIRFTTSAVNIRSGNYVKFQTPETRIGPEHIMASGALPPGLPAVEIEGEQYWDGGLISNTPLQWVLDEHAQDTLIFQVDLWNARSHFPLNMTDVLARQKEIQYSSRTRAITDHFCTAQKLRHNYAKLYSKLPDELKATKEAKILMDASDTSVHNIVHLIYRAKDYENYAKDYQFSYANMLMHWKAGYNDTKRSLQHKEIFKKPDNTEGIKIFDVTQT
ncbi:MAG: patatin-like phospholipase family protein [Rhodospirillales bacterium]|nr:patatin-like phospholipase family protein [Alphaproteobacteria bacterium]MCB9976838.1 patatin-like phospholipase family protein [Rhodospirillales bacterium]